MNRLNNVQLFIVFCLEAFKIKNKLTGTNALKLFESNNVFLYLEQGYEVLHTQSIDYVVAEIQELISNQK